MDEESDALFLDDEVESVVDEAMSSPSESTVLEAEIVESSGNGVKMMFQGFIENLSRAFTSFTQFAGSVGGAVRIKANKISEERSTKIERAAAVRKTKESSESIVMVASGIQSYEWGLIGMDCPDCASKATRAVSRIDGVESCEVSFKTGPYCPI